MTYNIRGYHVIQYLRALRTAPEPVAADVVAYWIAAVIAVGCGVIVWVFSIR